MSECGCTAEQKREAALDFIEFVGKSGAASPIMLQQLRLAARLWAFELGAEDDLLQLNAENQAVLQRL